MQGRIIRLKKGAKLQAKLEVWADAPDERDMGGYCHICEKYIYNTLKLVKHFVEKHEKEVMEGTGMATGAKALEMQEEG